MAGREASVAGPLRYLLSVLLLVGGVWMPQHRLAKERVTAADLDFQFEISPF
jgi:hypothetical protein